MNKKQKAVLAVGLVFAMTFIFGVPLWSATSPGGVAVLGAPSSGHIRYSQSVSCLAGGVIGDYYWQGSLYFGCGPIVP